jgi:hypothetical protein
LVRGDPVKTPEELRKAGFEPVADWLLDGEGIKLSAMPPAGCAVYAFLLNGQVVYIGKTTTCVRRRMYGYRKPSLTQPTNNRVKALVVAALKGANQVQLWTVAPPSTTWMGLPVNTVVGLEEALIADMNPLWNMMGNKQALAEVQA